MVKSMRHEPFYVTGAWTDESQGVYIGWAVRENSFSDGMPLRNEKGDVTLVFSGEDYPEPGTPRRLKEQGHAFEDGGASYLVHLYEEDPNFLRNLNGHFQGLVADRVRETATLFNDRFGVQRLYFNQSDDAFYFSAEAKAILEVRPELREFDPRGLGEFISCGCALENRALFAGIETLPPGSAWTFRNGSLERRALYFDPAEWEEQEALGPDAYYEQLRDSFASALPRYFNGKEAVGVSLTGGLDTRIIMAWRKAEPNTLPCYTFGSMYRENEDVHLARRVAEICKQPYHLITVSKDVVEHFPEYAERTIYLTDGCVDVSRSLDLYNNARARQIAPVRMVGTFGSEIIRNAVMFKHKPPQEDIFQPEILEEVSRACVTYDDQILKGNRISAVAFRQTAAYHYGGLALEQSQLTMRWPYLDNEIVKTVFRAPRDREGEDVRFRLIRDGSRELARLPTDRGLNGSDSLSSAIKHAYLEFTFKAEYAYDYGMPQWVAQVDHAFAPFHLERVWLGRHKLFHFRYWYRTLLANYVREVLLDSRSLARPYLKRKSVERIVHGHLKGNRNYTTEIHRLLSLELLHRVFSDARNIAPAPVEIQSAQ